VKVFGCRLHG